MLNCVAVAGGARTGGNCAEIAQWILDTLPDELTSGKSLIELASRKISPCQGCTYECLKAPHEPCAMSDDVESIWREVYGADVVILVVPTYGGTPPALWMALFERLQGLWRLLNRNQNQFWATVVVASEEYAIGGEFTPQIMKGITEAKSECTAFLWITPHSFKESSVEVGLVRYEGVVSQLQTIIERITAWKENG